MVNMNNKEKAVLIVCVVLVFLVLYIIYIGNEPFTFRGGAKKAAKKSDSIKVKGSRKVSSSKASSATKKAVAASASAVAAAAGTATPKIATPKTPKTSTSKSTSTTNTSATASSASTTSGTTVSSNVMTGLPPMVIPTMTVGSIAPGAPTGMAPVAPVGAPVQVASDKSTPNVAACGKLVVPDPYIKPKISQIPLDVRGSFFQGIASLQKQDVTYDSVTNNMVKFDTSIAQNYPTDQNHITVTGNEVTLNHGVYVLSWNLLASASNSVIAYLNVDNAVYSQSIMLTPVSCGYVNNSNTCILPVKLSSKVSLRVDTTQGTVNVRSCNFIIYRL